MCEHIKYTNMHFTRLAYQSLSYSYDLEFIYLMNTLSSRHIHTRPTFISRRKVPIEGSLKAYITVNTTIYRPIGLVAYYRPVCVEYLQVKLRLLVQCGNSINNSNK